ncbi:AAA family ATPase [Gillisia sp. Hel_I_29]|uniref:AAA family ATPase n=1 Tax=Gillisia sp. Hel_I_29 TaxID=1249975 RepID=UPI0012E03F14|nr:AAA family ATPase [Gillisia sp. Hel_I_29]
MNTHFENHTLYNISEVYNTSVKSKLSAQVFQKIDGELKYLSSKLKLSKEEAFIFSMIFTLNLEDSTASFSSISKVLKCNVIDLMPYASFFKSLQEKQLIIEKKEKGNFGKTFHQFIISDAIQEAVINNEFPLKPQINVIKSAIEVLEKIYEFSAQHNQEEISSFELFMRTDELLERYGDFPIIKNIDEFKLSNIDKGILLYVLWKTITGSETVFMSVALEGIIKNTPYRIQFSQKLISGDNELIKKNLIELEKATFFNDSDLKLSEKGRGLLEKEGIKIGEIDKKDIVSCEKIRSKSLYYNEKENQSISLLSKALEAKRFHEIQDLLESKSLPIGLNCIFYGPPGTGKTEGVLQMAKTTGRDLMRVDISETKSKWFGDSEKLIKKIFTRYEGIRTSQEMTPILLFNEADAILSRRTGNSDSNVDQTKNTIQNILLEELENFKGIFIATTNLIENLDSAFERRFLFKIQIESPGLIAREKIWQQKLDFLSPNQYLELAQSFQLSGGEIDNITRKILMHEILNDEKIEFKKILEFCNQEKFEFNSETNFKGKKNTIRGFRNNKNERTSMAR